MSLEDKLYPKEVNTHIKLDNFLIKTLGNASNKVQDLSSLSREKQIESLFNLGFISGSLALGVEVLDMYQNELTTDNLLNGLTLSALLAIYSSIKELSKDKSQPYSMKILQEEEYFQTQERFNLARYLRTTYSTLLITSTPLLFTPLIKETTFLQDLSLYSISTSILAFTSAL